MLDRDWIKLLEMGIRRNINMPGPQAFMHFKGREGEFLDDFCNFETNPEYRTLMYFSPIADILIELIDSKNLWLYYEQIFYKQGPAEPTIWHQDVPQYIAKGEQQLTMWITPNSLTDLEALSFIKGTHLGPVYDLTYGKNTAAFINAEEDILANMSRGQSKNQPTIPDYDRPEYADQILSWNLAPGDAFVFYNTTVHGRAPIPEGKQRRSFSARCFGDDIVFAPCPVPVPEFPKVDEFVKPGEPLRHPIYFPQLRPLSKANPH